ncbi:MAG: glutamine-hydrolyzing GMP synthase [Atopobiaceae bacterium]|uniref:glutamine-hydrolyzing GMP synthase n=1 Tax=Olsenella uli TaxID=133926 RepID=UPI003D7B7897|nr:glutamine-hydrolyzing GMP synthase [Atopobiaceae bacterium]
MTEAQPKQFVAVLDFGAQYGQLIARRVRDLNVYSEIVPCDIPADELAAMKPAALILSGGPASVNDPEAPRVDPGIYELGVPVLGFCYGHQITAVTLGGKVFHPEVGEYGHAELEREAGSALFNNTPMKQTVWMSHFDAVCDVPEGFKVTARTKVCPVAAMENPERKIYTTQFHPEVKHTEYGQQILSNFLFDICKLEKNWSMDNLVETMTQQFREKVGDNRVILALSGGVDSSVVAALGARAIGKQMTCVFINHGLLRKNEPEQVEEVFTKQFDVDFIHVHAEDRYAELLAGVTEPEQKRRIIGTQFWKEFFAVAQQLETDGKPVKYLAQGTIYPDIIESGARKTGGKASTIKSHHNLIPFPEGVSFDLIEPLDHFFKDEVRELGLALGLPAHIVYRQPFPGPGLAIRIIGAVDKEKLEILKNADAIVREELDAYNQRLFEKTGERNSEHSCWQYFAVLPDIKSVGVMGDERTYQRPIILRAVESSDAMTADWAKIPYDVLARISGRIVAEVPGANRVCYDITSKPPATIEWE